MAFIDEMKKAGRVKAEYPGQLLPTPTTENSVERLIDNVVQLKAGFYGSLVITISAPKFTTNPTRSVLDILGGILTALKNGVDPFFLSKPVYVCIPKLLVFGTSHDETMISLFSFLTSAHFEFHMYHRNTEQFVFKGGNTSKVPVYGSSIEGVTGLVLSPDETKVLLVFERGGWATPGGAVDLEDASILHALKREVREEVGVDIDLTWTGQVLLFGWHESRSRERELNDNFKAFAVRASSEEFQMDGVEITAAEWQDWATILSGWNDMRKPRDKKIVEINGQKYLLTLLEMLETYASGRAMRVVQSANDRTGGIKTRFISGA